MAGKKGGKRKKKVETVFLVCDETGEYNYTLRRKTGSEKLKVKKYCPRLRRHTSHTEKKAGPKGAKYRKCLPWPNRWDSALSVSITEA